MLPFCLLPVITVLATALDFFSRLVVVVDDYCAFTGPTAPYLVSALGLKGGASAVTRTSPGNQSFKNIFLLVFSFRHE
jgi:hypothetical protein